MHCAFASVHSYHDSVRDFFGRCVMMSGDGVDGCLTRSAEWDAIMYQQLMLGEVMLIAATAGAGKSTALREYTRMRPNVRTLYLTFSKDSRDEMQTQYQSPEFNHVDVRTVSSFAWEATNKALNIGQKTRRLSTEVHLKKHLAEIMGDQAGMAVRTQSDCDLVTETLEVRLPACQHEPRVLMRGPVTAGLFCVG